MGYDQILSQGDLLPVLEQQLLNPDGSAPDLRGATVECRVMRGDRTRPAVISAATLVNARGGYVSHAWLAYEVAFPGVLLVQFRRTDGGNVQTWPADRFLTVLVNPGLLPAINAPAPSPVSGDSGAAFVIDNIGLEWGFANTVGEEDVVDDPRVVPFGDLPSGNYTAKLLAHVKVSGGTGTFYVRLGGTLGLADGTIIAQGTTTSTTYVKAALTGSAFASPGGNALVQITGKDDTVGQTAWIKGASIELLPA